MSSPGFFIMGVRNTLNPVGKWPTASDRLKSTTTNGAITSMICWRIDIGIESAAENVSGSRWTALMMSSMASGEKARNATSDLARRNIGGGEPLVLDCNLATFSTKKRLIECPLTSLVSVGQIGQTLFCRHRIGCLVPGCVTNYPIIATLYIRPNKKCVCFRFVLTKM